MNNTTDTKPQMMLLTPDLSPAEEKMWVKPSSSKPPSADINVKYESGEQRIVTETNREKLPNFVEALRKPGYLNLSPFYQRRSRWDVKRKSRLIESFIINIPVPPV